MLKNKDKFGLDGCSKPLPMVGHGGALRLGGGAFAPGKASVEALRARKPAPLRAGPALNAARPREGAPRLEALRATVRLSH